MNIILFLFYHENTFIYKTYVRFGNQNKLGDYKFLK